MNGELRILEGTDIESSSTSIRMYSFDQSGQMTVGSQPKGTNWPVVYMIYGDRELYVGETSNAAKRFSEHLANPERSSLKHIGIVFDSTFNKSAILDIEQSLIHLFNADRKFVLQNRNSGQSAEHDYYHREIYARKVDIIWELLRTEHALAEHSYTELKNSDLFKYSPYMSLTPEQNEACNAVLNDIFKDRAIERPDGGTFVITGVAGTGKTVVAINLISRIIDAMEHPQDPVYDYEFEDADENTANGLRRYIKEMRESGKTELRLGMIEPMKSMRKTLTDVFRANGKLLKKCSIIGPHDVFKDDYDIVLVDESHRLPRRKNLVSGEYTDFDDKCNLLGLDPHTSTALDWIVRRCRYRILFYDRNQTIRGSDMLPEQFGNVLGDDYKSFELRKQMRCEGGTDYIEYMGNILDCKQTDYVPMNDFSLQLFDSAEEMINEIKALDYNMGLCRNVSGYSWPWTTKYKDYDTIISDGLFDIEIEGKKYIWNTSDKGWILSPHAVDEIGCVHTVQGFDLNYVGVIFGREIDFDPDTDSIIINKELFFDNRVKRSLPDDGGVQLKTYIINTYKVLMTRGIKGCYVYAYNENLRKYLNRFIST